MARAHVCWSRCQYLAAGRLAHAGRHGSDSYVRDNRGLLQSQKSPAGRQYYLTDGHPGSVAALTDSARHVAVRYRYDPFGQDKGQTGGRISSPCRMSWVGPWTTGGTQRRTYWTMFSSRRQAGMFWAISTGATCAGLGIVFLVTGHLALAVVGVVGVVAMVWFTKTLPPQ